MKVIKLITNGVYLLAVLLLVFVAVATAFSVIKGPGGIRFFVVQSGSMEPKIKIGSVVVVVPQNEYGQGDVITFLANPKANLKQAQATVTHRIFEVFNDEGIVSYTTKGDANEDPDRERVQAGSVLGKVMVSLPLLGYLVSFTKTQTGFIALIVIPGTLIIYSELVSIKKELQRMFGEWKKKSKLKKEVKTETKKVIKKTKNQEEKTKTKVKYKVKPKNKKSTSKNK